jgi:hypothetical protein
MKDFLRIASFLILFLIVGCAGTSQYMIKAPPVEAPSPNKALVYFMRPSGLGFAIHFQIWDGYRLIGLSQAKSYFAYECDPGKHLFIGIAENKRAVEADLEAGKAYYVITQVKMGGWKPRMAFIPVTKSSEFWDKVEAYKRELNFIAPEEEKIAEWKAEREAKIQRELNEIIGYLKTPEGKNYIVKLNKEDGR